MSDEQRKKPTKNWALQVILCACVAGWQIYDLTAPGEAQPQMLVILEFVLLGCALVGLVGGVAMLLSRR